MLRALACLTFGSLALGCDDKPDYQKPVAPNLDQLIEAYQHPTADFEIGTFEFDAGNAQSIEDVALAVWDELEETGVIDQVTDLIEEAAEQHQQAEEQTSTTDRVAISAPMIRAPSHLTTLQAAGTLRGTRICNGWGAQPVADQEANGFIRLIVNFNERGLDPVVWGTAENCHYRVGDRQVLLDNPTGSDSAIAAHLGDNATVDGFGDSPILFRFGLRVSVDGEVHEFEQDLRYDLSQELLELRVPFGDGYVIAAVSAGALGQIRARNGSFACQGDPPRCGEVGRDL